MIRDPTGPHKLLPLWEHPFADVYAAGDGQRKRAVLLAFLRRGIADSDAALQRCIEVHKKLAEVKSAFIYKLAETRRIRDGRLVLAGDLLEGTTLAQHLLDGEMTPARAIPILRQICHALDAAHGIGIVHGALSAASVILTTVGGREDTVKLTDFGLGEEITPGGMGDHEIELQPLSPEKVLGSTRDVREDIYLLGAVAYAALSGRFVFEGLPDEVRLAHASAQPKPLEAPAVLQAIVLRCLAKRPEDRFASVREVEDALLEAQRSAGIASEWDDLPRRVDVSAHGAAGTPAAIGRDPSQPIALKPKIPSGPFEILGSPKTPSTAFSEASGAVRKSDLAPAIGSAASRGTAVVPRAEDAKAEADTKPYVAAAAEPARPAPKPITHPATAPQLASTKPAAAPARAPGSASERSEPRPVAPVRRDGERSGLRPPPEIASVAERSGLRGPPTIAKPSERSGLRTPQEIGKPAEKSGLRAPSEIGKPAERSGLRPPSEIGKPAERSGLRPPAEIGKPAERSGLRPPAEVGKPAETSGLRSPAEVSSERRASALGLNLKGSGAPSTTAPRRDPILPKPPGIKPLSKAGAAEAAKIEPADATAAAATGATASDEHDAAATTAAPSDAKQTKADAAKPDAAGHDAATPDTKLDAKDAEPVAKPDAKDAKPDAKAPEIKPDAAARPKAADRPAESAQVVRPAAPTKPREKVPTWMWAAGLLIFVAVPIVLLVGDDDEPPPPAKVADKGNGTAPAKTTPPPRAPEDPVPQHGAPPDAADDAVGRQAGDGEAVPADDGEAVAADDGAAVPADDGAAVPSDDGAPVGDDGAGDGTPPTVAPDMPTPDRPSPAKRAAEYVSAAKKAAAAGNVSKAESLYKSALAVSPKNHTAAAGLGQIYFNKANYAQSSNYYGRAVKAAPSSADYRIRLGDALFKQNKFADAKKHYVKAKSLGSGQADARIKKCDAKLGK